jgi:ubiquinone/menaquinone biosynthesis C-methylase UbiE
MVDIIPNLRSSDANLLERRIAANQSSQGIDFNRWIFQGMQFPPEGNLLELCCGTGTQTERFLRGLKGKGRYIGLDKSGKALDLIREKIPPDQASRMTLLCSDMDLLGSSLKDHGLGSLKFDLVFCSYGLYYSSDVPNLLSEAETYLRKDGQMIIVGPYGPNNESLFSTLEEAGVRIPDYVRYTSQDFMHDTVLPWGTLHFTSLSIRTLVNPVVWTSVDQVLAYWKNSTFLDPDRIPEVIDRLKEHFAGSSTFVNRKYVMMVVMKHE